ncbi:uncharacterized protein LOC143293487 [Babylonia areolata]|uniref:uncharacterized protein LOC143293487 n=1 Tax=Babylonia areolata TaxID=304850 RepID=UPI003FD3E9DC
MGRRSETGTMWRRGWWRWRWLLMGVMGSLLVMLPAAQGSILCVCTTEECLSEGKRTCYAEHHCYSQYFEDTLSRGCIDGGSPLLCENRRPKGVDNWPSLFCCSDRDYCNKDVNPTLPLGSPDNDGKKVTAEKEDSGGTPPEEPRPVPEDLPPVRCQNGAGGGGGGGGAGGEDMAHSSGGKVINPIYIAVPVAGVCVLLALVIFAMYLLRRRNHHHHYDNYHHYHDHLPPAPPHAHTKPGGGGAGGSGGGGGGSGGGGGGGGGSGLPLYHHHHHCDCVCQKSLPPCGGKVNRCTDSERSSSGSETKLFLQA